jgi:hypothetical protein
MRVQASLEFLLIASALAALSLSVISIYGKSMVPEAETLNSSQPNILAAANQSISYSMLQQTFFSAEISRKKEIISYQLSTPAYLLNLSEWSHCTNFGFFGGIMNFESQCNTYDAWNYRAGSAHCPTTSVYCFYKSNATSFVSSIGDRRRHVYNFSLSISSPSGMLLANISSSDNESIISASNRTVGYAHVSRVSSSDPTQYLMLISDGNSTYQLNQTAYWQYLQWKNSALSILHYYNSTGVDGDTLAIIKQTLSSFFTASNTLENFTTGTKLPCNLTKQEYACNAEFPFSYIIDAKVSSAYLAVNQTLYYMGSVIELHN